MKTPLDPRHIKREKAIKALFSFSFQEEEVKNQLTQAVVKKRKEIDKIIAEAAPEWPIGQINRVDLAILRLAVFELVIQAKEPPKVVIDEAVELAKKYGSEKSPGFVNGVLGTILKESDKVTKKQSINEN